MTVYEINVWRSEPEKVGVGFAAPRVPLLDMKTEDADLAAMNLQMLAKKMMAEPAGLQPSIAVVLGDLRDRISGIYGDATDIPNLIEEIARKHGVTL